MKGKRYSSTGAAILMVLAVFIIFPPFLGLAMLFTGGYAWPLIFVPTLFFYFVAFVALKNWYDRSHPPSAKWRALKALIVIVMVVPLVSHAYLLGGVFELKRDDIPLKRPIRPAETFAMVYEGMEGNGSPRQLRAALPRAAILRRRAKSIR